jgi:hypothetical protein
MNPMSFINYQVDLPIDRISLKNLLNQTQLYMIFSTCLVRFYIMPHIQKTIIQDGYTINKKKI